MPHGRLGADNFSIYYSVEVLSPRGHLLVAAGQLGGARLQSTDVRTQEKLLRISKRAQKKSYLWAPPPPTTSMVVPVPGREFRPTIDRKS